MWRVIKNMYEATRSAIFLKGEKFRVQQGVAQGCSLSYNTYKWLGIEISRGERMGGMLFADDLVGVSE